jgi:hypothetical protein
MPSIAAPVRHESPHAQNTQPQHLRTLGPPTTQAEVCLPPAALTAEQGVAPQEAPAGMAPAKRVGFMEPPAAAGPGWGADAPHASAEGARPGGMSRRQQERLKHEQG